MYVIDLREEQKVDVIITKASNSDLKGNKDFEFNWKSEIEFDIYKLESVSTGEIFGLVSINIISEELRIEIRLLEIQKLSVGKTKRHDRIAGILIAYVCKLAFDFGFYGFVSLIPKTRLIDHYKNKYGFKQFGRQLAVQIESSAKLMTKYLTHE